MGSLKLRCKTFQDHTDFGPHTNNQRIKIPWETQFNKWIDEQENITIAKVISSKRTSYGEVNTDSLTVFYYKGE